LILLRVHRIDNSPDQYLVEFANIPLIPDLNLVAVVVNENVDELGGLHVGLVAGSHKAESSLELANYFLPRLYLLCLEIIFALKLTHVLKHKDTFAEAWNTEQDLQQGAEVASVANILNADQLVFIS